MRNPAVYFEISDIVEYAIRHPSVTGIQRTVLRIVESLVRRGDHEVYGLIKHPVTGKWSVADLSWMREEYDIGDFAARFDLPSGKELWLIEKLQKYHKRPVKRFIGRLKCQMRWALSSKLRQRVQLKFGNLETKPSCLNGMTVKRRSIIAHLGAGWALPYEEVTAFAKANQCETAWMVYDLIPVTRGRLTIDGCIAKTEGYKNSRFHDYICHIAGTSRKILCISDYTRKELDLYFSWEGPVKRADEYHTVAFPHEFKCRAPAPVRSEAGAILHEKYVLCVGSIEIRKNLLQLAHAWGRLKDEGLRGLPKLIFAGGLGWGVEELLAILEDTNYLGGMIQIVERPNDAELELLYKNCQFTVFPSFFEGWGLPIGESLWFGKPVICADNSSMPEAGGKFATYFSHSEPGSLLAAIRKMITHPVKLPPDIRKHLRTWDDTADDLYAAITGIGQKIEAELIPAPAKLVRVK